MSKSQTWLATKNDAELVLAWFRDAGARPISGDRLDGEWEPDGREVVLHFPAIGPIEYWPTEVEIPEVGDNSPSAKRAILAAIIQHENPGCPVIDVDRSAIASLKLPELRDGRYWVAGHVDFPTSRLKVAFPELNRTCQRFERFLKKHALVFDNTKGANQCGFGSQICDSGIIHRIFALPEAFDLLRGGAYMVDYMTSHKAHSDFLQRLQLSGHEA